jgi:hypothetical protein
MGPPPGPPNKSGSNNALIAVAIIAVLLLCCCLPVGLSIFGPFAGVLALSGMTQSINNATTVPAPAVPKGTEVVVDGWGVTVVEADLDATAAATAADPSFRPRPGKRPVWVTVKVRNGEPAPAMYSTNILIGLWAPGDLIATSPSFRMSSKDALTEIIPAGGTATGRLEFEVDEADASTVSLSVEPFGRSGAKKLTALR